MRKQAAALLDSTSPSPRGQKCPPSFSQSPTQSGPADASIDAFLRDYLGREIIAEIFPDAGHLLPAEPLIMERHGIAHASLVGMIGTECWDMSQLSYRPTCRPV